MTRVVLLYLLSILALPSWLHGQEPVIRFSGTYEELCFAEFAADLETQCKVTFFYRESWVSDIRVTLSGNGLSLQSTLDSILAPHGLGYFLDEWKHLFLIRQTNLLSELPAYSSPTDSVIGADADNEKHTRTRAEQNYMNGRKIRVPEILQVGSEERSVEGKEVLIHGKLSDTDSGEPLVGATLYIPELRKGSSTDADGRFSLLIPTGSYAAECNSMGMEDLYFTLVVHADGDLVIGMKRTLIPLDEVVVRAKKFHNVSGSQMGFERLNYNIFKEVPLVMGERDILNVVRMLPGVQSVGEGSAGFNVRGSAADQNMISISKVPVYNSAHLFGFFTTFSPEIVADFSLYKSNLPASFGGRLASFFDIRTRQGNMKRFSARGGISTISAYAAVEGPIRKDKSSFLLSARSTYSDWLLRYMQDPVLRNSEAGFNDFSGVYTVHPGEDTRIKVFGYRSRDRFKLGKNQTFAYGNAGASVDVQHRINPRITGNLALIYSKYQFRNSDIQLPSAGYEHAYNINHYELRSDFSWISLGKHYLTFGIHAIYYDLDRGVIEPYGRASLREPVELGVENGIESAIYLADEIKLTDRLTAYVGLRVSGFMALGPSLVRTYSPGMPQEEENVIDTLHFGKGEIVQTYYGLEPRLNLRFLTGTNSSIKASYNRGYQYLFMLSNTVAVAPSDQWKLSDYHLRPQYLDQLSAGYYRDFPQSGLSTSMEIYRKWGKHIVDYRDGASFTESPHAESETLQGRQDAYGIEAMIRKHTGMLNGWMAYTFARSFMEVDLPRTGEQINGGMPYPSVYDRPHSFSLVANYKQGRRLSFSSNLVYMTGRPVTYPVALYYEYDIPYIHYSDRNRYRLPDYFRLDFSINLEGSLKKKKPFHSYWMLSVYNLTGRKNAYSVFFKNVGGRVSGYKLSIFGQPMFTLSWNLKLGNYASE